MGHHQVSNCVSEETIQCSIRNDISLWILHCIVSFEAQFETWWWPIARAETCCLSNKILHHLISCVSTVLPLPS